MRRFQESGQLVASEEIVGGELGLFYLQESLEGVPGPVRVLPKEEAQV